MSAGHKWKRLQRAVPKAPAEELIKAWMEHHKVGREEALRLMQEDFEQSELWLNDLYQVEVRNRADPKSWVHLNIRRVDGYPGRDLPGLRQAPPMQFRSPAVAI